jgi:hypothetical protein
VLSISANFPLDQTLKVVHNQVFVVLHLFVSFHYADINSRRVDFLHFLHRVTFVLGAYHVKVFYQELKRLLGVSVLALHVKQQSKFVACLCLLLFALNLCRHIDNVLKLLNRHAKLVRVLDVGLCQLFVGLDQPFRIMSLFMLIRKF